MPFRKKDLKGLSKFEISEKQRQSENVRGTHTLQDNSPKSHSTTSKEPEFVNWFALDDVKSQTSTLQNTKCTYTDKYGKTVSLDESYEALQRD